MRGQGVMEFNSVRGRSQKAEGRSSHGEALLLLRARVAVELGGTHNLNGELPLTIAALKGLEER